MKTEIVTFNKAHNYGGHAFHPGDKLELPSARARTLRAAGVLEDKAAKKAKDKK